MRDVLFQQCISVFYFVFISKDSAISVPSNTVNKLDILIRIGLNNKYNDIN